MTTLITWDFVILIILFNNLQEKVLSKDFNFFSIFVWNVSFIFASRRVKAEYAKREKIIEQHINCCCEGTKQEKDESQPKWENECKKEFCCKCCWWANVVTNNKK